jgi:acetyl esterase
LAKKAWAAYLRDVQGAVPAYASPATSSDLSRLPPAFVSAEGEDILRDEAIAFAQGLLAAGVPTDLRVYAGAYHGSFAFSPKAKTSVQHFADINAALARFLRGNS